MIKDECGLDNVPYISQLCGEVAEDGAAQSADPIAYRTVPSFSASAFSSAGASDSVGAAHRLGLA